ncbi:Peptidylprolyl isomerase [Altererythrobacter insulae]|nr:Peptidylprolyl isomerase [Altererythrobacter insulae]
MTPPDWTREPLVHFLVAGTAIFALLAWRAGDVDPASRSITIDREQQAQIALVFERTMNRAPTDAELDAQIDRYVRDEVLYREALRLGLDQSDAVVRRRMAQKMDILASAQAETVQPSDETLLSHYTDNPDAFAKEVTLTFDQLYFADKDIAEQALLQIGQAPEWQQQGEAISLPQSVTSASRQEVTDRFGTQFHENLSRLNATEEWQGPIGSGFGWHLVRLREVTASQVPPFDAIKADVEDHWRTQTIAQRKADAYQLLRDAYDVTVER